MSELDPATPPAAATDTPSEAALVTDEHPERDPLAPWGAQGPAPEDEWREDILGPGFESRTLALLPDDEGEVVATLVRYVPDDDPLAPATNPVSPRFIALYVHGRNDYFFHPELARTIAAARGAFYALDLRKYGRSLRPHQTIGFIGDLSEYDEDISEALDVIRSDIGRHPLVLIGHSTGGLPLTLWAYRHPGAVAGVILTSAWLEMQTMAAMRPAMQPVLGRIAARNPLWSVPRGSSPDFYARALMEGWAGSGFDLPARLRGYEDDPGVRGWTYATEWKRPESYPAYAQWLDAILLAQEVVEHRVRLECPVLSMASTSSYFGSEWTAQALTADTVLDVEVIVERSATLGPLVTIARFDGRHDLFLSDPDVREQVWDVMGRWLGAFV